MHDNVDATQRPPDGFPIFHPGDRVRYQPRHVWTTHVRPTCKRHDLPIGGKHRGYEVPPDEACGTGHEHSH
jgi:hypothetical protein